MAVKKICVIGLGKCGVPLSAVIAYKCPEIRVTVVKSNPEEIFQWNTGKIPQAVPGLEEIVRKCQNKNLIFSTNDVLAIKEAEIIFIQSESVQKSRGEGQRRTVDLSAVEDVAYSIAEHAESNKIVVESSTIPLKSAECVTNVLKHNGKPGVEFQVLSNPEFYEHGSPIRNLLFPKCVLVGSDGSQQGAGAVRKVLSVLERWIPAENIITRTNWSVELSKIATLAMSAQALAAVMAISPAFEDSGADIVALLKMQTRTLSLPELNSNVGKFPLALHNLVYACEFLDLRDVADYWREVLNMFSMHQERFLKKFIWTISESWNRRIALLGFACYKDTQVTDSVAVDLCKSFLEESAAISIYDTRVTKDQVIEDLKAAGCATPEDKLGKLVTVTDDPYKAVEKSQAIVACGTWKEFSMLDYSKIYSDMVKPAYVFDRWQALPYEKLAKIGFHIYSFGRPPLPRLETDKF